MASNTDSDPAALLLPAPKSVTTGEGALALTAGTRIYLPPDTGRPELLAAGQLARDIALVIGAPVPDLDRQAAGTPAPVGSISLTVADKPVTRPGARDAYTIRVTPGGATIRGASAHGLFYGIQTLRQLVRIHGSSLPALEIDDAPDFERRGFYHDVSRGKIPTRETLFWLIDYLALHKANEFQLYVEHTFAFPFDPTIQQTPDALTADDIIALDAYCRDRRMEFVPSLQSFGHMAGVLSVPHYRHLADIEIDATWDRLTWNQRMHGLTIDCSSPEALALLRRMHDTYLPLFTAPYINACADETYDLGRGKTRALAEEMTTGRLYLKHISWLRDVAAAHGKRLMIWGDIVKKYPDLIPEIPKDIILLNWGYSANTDFESSKLFADAGLDFYVCPGTSSWNRIVNDLDNADLNIRRYAAAGKKHGAIGLLNTDWGDHGHFAPLAGTLHGAALGAAMSWHTDVPTSAAFDRAWDFHTFGSADAGAAANLRAQSLGASTWHHLYDPIVGPNELKNWVVRGTPDPVALREAAIDGATLFARLRPSAREPWIADQLLLASRFNVLLADKIDLQRDLVAAIEVPLEDLEKATDIPANLLNDDLRQRLANWALTASQLLREYEAQWRAANRESSLADIRSFLWARMTEAQTLACLPR